MRWSNWILALMAAGLLSCGSRRDAYQMPFGLRYPVIARDEVSVKMDSCCNQGELVELLVREGAHRVDLSSGQQKIRAVFAELDSLKLGLLQTKISRRCIRLSFSHQRL